LAFLEYKVLTSRVSLVVEIEYLFANSVCVITVWRVSTINDHCSKVVVKSQQDIAVEELRDVQSRLHLGQVHVLATHVQPLADAHLFRHFSRGVLEELSEVLPLESCYFAEFVD